MERFKLTERQADDILEMRLRQLARLEGIKIEQELAGKREEQVRLQELLDNPASLKRLLVKEIEADAKQYGDDRRTLIETAERAVLETKVLDEPVTVIVSQKGWLRAPGPRPRCLAIRLQAGRRPVWRLRMPHHRHADRGGRQRPRLLRRRVGPAVGARRRPADHHHDRPGKRFAHRAHDRGGRRFALAAGHARRLRLRGQALGHVQPPACRQAVHHAGSRRRAAAAGAAVRRRDAAALLSDKGSSWCSAWTRSRVCREAAAARS